MRTVPKSIEAQLERAREIAADIAKLCLEQVETPSDVRLAKIGVYVGSMANHVRSALNYAIAGFVETDLRPLLSKAELKQVKKFDFPYNLRSEAHFKSIGLVGCIYRHFPTVYQFLESIQPYHEGGVWLGHVMQISNIDKHIRVNQVDMPDIYAIGTSSGTKISFVGGQFVVQYPTGGTQTFNPPCYIPYFYMFASTQGKMTIYRITLTPNGPNPGLSTFTMYAPDNASRLIERFYSLV